MNFHEDPLLREELIRDYLLRRLEGEATESFESHYLGCEECFQELRTTHLLMTGLVQSKINLDRREGVLVLQFNSPVQLTRQSRESTELLRRVVEQGDTKVLLDLSQVSRIDSAGLGLLMSCYSHAVRHQGMLKLLKPTPEVEKLLHVTRIDSVVETYHDERQALESFR